MWTVGNRQGQTGTNEARRGQTWQMTADGDGRKPMGTNKDSDEEKQGRRDQTVTWETAI